MKDDLTFAEIKLADYFSNSINFNYEVNIFINYLFIDFIKMN